MYAFRNQIMRKEIETEIKERLLYLIPTEPCSFIGFYLFHYLVSYWRVKERRSFGPQTPGDLFLFLAVKALRTFFFPALGRGLSG